MFLILSCSFLFPIHWNQVLSSKWRCSWSSADRRCSNYIWVINNFCLLRCSDIRGLTVPGTGYCGVFKWLCLRWWSQSKWRRNFDHLKWDFNIVICCKNTNLHVLDWVMPQWHHIGTHIWVNMSSGNGLMPDDTKPLCNSVFINCKGYLVIFTFGQYAEETHPWYEFQNYLFKITDTSPIGQWVKAYLLVSARKT